ncbi:hypothetical protein [Streptomyces sp. 2A115]|uniref:hypothetical protein n=1 Tax=Streptomyces sp. 2A115 TaxID=3457439 RepID=UPI003FD12A21
MADQRCHLTLYSGTRPVAHGWWAAKATAERKFRTWIGEHGNVDGARVVLTDEVEGEVLAIWPDGEG